MKHRTTSMSRPCDKPRGRTSQWWQRRTAPLVRFALDDQLPPCHTSNVLQENERPAISPPEWGQASQRHICLALMPKDGKLGEWLGRFVSSIQARSTT